MTESEQDQKNIISFVSILVLYVQVRAAVPSLPGMGFGSKVMWEIN